MILLPVDRKPVPAHPTPSERPAAGETERVLGSPVVWPCRYASPSLKVSTGLPASLGQQNDCGEATSGQYSSCCYLKKKDWKTLHNNDRDQNSSCRKGESLLRRQDPKREVSYHDHVSSV